MKIPSVRAELFRADGQTDRQTDMTKQTLAFRGFVKAPKKTSQLTLYGEIVAVCSQIHTKHINTLCGQNVELLNVKLAVHTATRQCGCCGNVVAHYKQPCHTTEPSVPYSRGTNFSGRPCTHTVGLIA